MQILGSIGNYYYCRRSDSRTAFCTTKGGTRLVSGGCTACLHTELLAGDAVGHKPNWVGIWARMCFSRKTRVKSKHFISAQRFCSVNVLLLFPYFQYISAYTPKPWWHPNACLQPRSQPAIPFTLVLSAKASSQLHPPNGLQVNKEGESPTELLPQQTAMGISSVGDCP